MNGVMFQQQANGQTPGGDRFPFPPIPVTLWTRFGLAELWLRPFGQGLDDQNIDFSHTPRPYLETQILASCTWNRDRPLSDHQFFWHLEVGKRTEALLTLATQGGRAELTVELTCLQPDCGEAMDLEFSLEELSQMQHRAEEHDSIEFALGNQAFSLRRPTGLDQLHWRSQSFPDESTALRMMIQSLVAVEQQEAFQAAWEKERTMAILNPLMAEMDPLVNLTLAVNCPACGAQDSHAVDLGAVALQRLWAVQDQLLETVHRLASHYHWTEAVILSLPPWRRDRFLTLIERERNR
jgi:hypothetical protein